MRLLAIDTALRACSVALVDRSSGLEISRSVEMERGHSEALFPMIQDVMRGAGVGFSSLSRIAVTIGPGSFTGLRVGKAAASGLALATGLPLMGVPSLMVLAYSAARAFGSFPDPFRIVLCVARGDVYYQDFDRDARPLEGQGIYRDDTFSALAPGMWFFSSHTGSIRKEEMAVFSPGGKVFSGGVNPSDLADIAARMPVSADPVNLLYMREAMVTSPLKESG